MSATELVFGVKVKIAGDLQPIKGPCLIVMNHRTRFDWMFLWCYLIRSGDLCTHKVILKSSLKKIPGFGRNVNRAWWEMIIQLGRNVNATPHNHLF